MVPEERLQAIAGSRKLSEYTMEMMIAQASLSKSSVIEGANKFLSTPIEESLDSNEILFNILALVDTRIEKKRILNMKDQMKFKHPIVQYFYEIRLSR